MSMFVEAVKSESKLRLGLVGPAGSGKTMTALRIAHGLSKGERFAVIDTEHGSASLYARIIRFHRCNLQSFEVENYISAITEAGNAGYPVLVIDSLSHAWSGKGGILEFVDAAGKRSAGGNFSAWRDATPRHNSLVEAILSCPCHVIVTMRSKTEYVIEKENGRTTVRKVGLQPVQRDGMEYEFTVCGDVTSDHDLCITKTRAPFLKDKVIREAGEELGKQLAQWLEDGEEVAPYREPVAPVASIDDTLEKISRASLTAIEGLMPKVSARHSAGELSDDQHSRIMAAIEKRIGELNTQTEVATT
jgi:hypothetical protein